MAPNQTQCANIQKNKQNCTCKSDKCPRHGVCCECVAYHRAAGNKPMCMK